MSTFVCPCGNRDNTAMRGQWSTYQATKVHVCHRCRTGEWHDVFPEERVAGPARVLSGIDDYNDGAPAEMEWRYPSEEKWRSVRDEPIPSNVEVRIQQRWRFDDVNASDGPFFFDPATG